MQTLAARPPRLAHESGGHVSSIPLQPSASSAGAAPVISSLRGETPADYIRRILSYSEGKDARAVLETTPKRLRAIVRETPASVLRRQPAPGKWSPAQILEHLADAEIVAGWRIRAILGQNGAPLQAFDQDHWASNMAYEKADPGESVALFEAIRVANLRLLDRVDPHLHENYGMHSERGKERFAPHTRTGHDLNHRTRSSASSADVVSWCKQDGTGAYAPCHL